MAIDSPALCIVGCGGHARSVGEIALGTGYATLLFVDANARDGERIFGFPVITFDAFADREAALAHHIAALGDNAAREAANAQVRRLTASAPANVIASDVRAGRDMELGEGVFIGAGVHLGPCVRIGDGAIINTRAVVEHESVVGAWTHVAVNATILGRAVIGRRVLVGARATILDGLNVGDDAVIGAGAVVVRDIVEPGVYAGVPARRIR
jgi:sugar O-acyltransferase (sialic acid O-acetyltransferase NeuD family)